MTARLQVIRGWSVDRDRPSSARQGVTNQCVLLSIMTNIGRGWTFEQPGLILLVMS